ncbi:MAG: methyl-accepting chemotaxis protein [Candidatus Pelagadaptatus aseana]|uniref:methyl-accepting chemotaxis protein n=1 Tax=Candidatus Pelagadaptatus aseana TaxID=3120508 RepID=UPI0039B173BF
MRLWLSQYLTHLIKLPIAILVIIMMVDTQRAITQYRSADYTGTVGMLLEKSMALTHEMQKERGMSAGFISSSGNKFSSELPRQRQLVDQALADLQLELEDMSLDEQTRQRIDELQGRWQQLPDMRRQIDGLSMPLAEMLKYFTTNNRLTIELSTLSSHHIADPRSREQFAALFNLANIKENAGIERAVLSSVFTNKAFNPDLYIRFLNLVNRQDTYLYAAELLTDKNFLPFLQEFKQSEEQQQVQAFRDIATGDGNNFDVAPETWFAAASKRINRLKQLEDTLLTQVSEHASQLKWESSLVVGVMLALLALTLYLAWVIHQTLAMSKRQTLLIAERMQSLTDNRDLTQSIDTITKDDLGKIALQLNDTLAQLRSDFESFQESAHEVAASSHQSVESSGQSKQGLLDMHARVENLTGLTQQLDHVVNGNIQQVSEAANMAEDVLGSAEQGTATLKQAVSSIKDTASDVATVQQQIEQLNSKVNEILSMVDIIRSVAEQTNLLALNAAIEAARAGEQGRGFAVVADEVRSLAQRTQNSTEDIAQIVDELIQSSQEAFATITHSTEKATATVEVIESIDSILNSTAEKMHSLNTMTANINRCSTQQLEELSRVMNNVNDIGSSANDGVATTEEVLTSANRLLQTADSMQEKITTYRI